MSIATGIDYIQQALSNSKAPGVAGSQGATGTDGKGAASAIADNAHLGKDEFLKLLVAQMENQDPMKPTDNAEMIAQTAQFSQVEQLTKVVTLLERMVTLQEDSQDAKALAQPVAPATQQA